ncbi:MAG: SDR family NAD(P)-dependent oxidoreductase [Hyphomicrobiales bacterium]|nr:SDR family NAD(P)-dependent oxidoreductase [Hyphomicrobiales bacterium]MCP5373833.1 SDR family NAD(P)-dependent oxidoreductase [Hyphomicrobiales bacterium]
MRDRIALITGASRGIGAAVAREFVRQGAHVIVAARTQGALEELDDEIKDLGGSATLVPLDVTDFDALDRMGAAIFERFGRIDILVGNAAVLGPLTPMHQVDPAIWQQTLDTNVTANWRLLRSCDPLLRASDAGRVIFVTADVGHRPKAYWGAYAVSKAALEVLARTYAAEVQKTAIKVNLVDPGPTRTRLRESAYPGENARTVKDPDSVVGTFVDLADPYCIRNGEMVSLV